jgi:hypothetical protein
MTDVGPIGPITGKTEDIERRKLYRNARQNEVVLSGNTRHCKEISIQRLLSTSRTKTFE